MTRIHATVMILFLPVACALGPRPFLGVPDDRVQTTDQKYPDIDFRLRGIPIVTKVATVPYRMYLDLKAERKITHEEQRRGWVYFAAEHDFSVNLPYAGREAADRAWLTRTERYRARIPETAKRKPQKVEVE